MNNTLPGGDACRHEMPAAMYRHVVDQISAKKTISVRRGLLPCRIVGEGGHHLDVYALLLEKLAKCDVMRRDACDLGGVIDSPNDDSHQLIARTVALPQLERFRDRKEFVDGVQAREIIAVATVKKSFLPNVDVEKTQQRTKRQPLCD